MSSHRSTKSDLRKKIVASVVFTAVAATALIGGSIAQLTDQGNSDQQSLVAGTVDIALSDDTDNVNFREPIAPMAPGDTFARYVNLNNVGNLAVVPLSISQKNGGGLLINGDAGVSVSVDACDTAWVEGKCTTVVKKDLLPKTALRSWTGFTPLKVGRFEPGSTIYFKFTTSLPAEADNAYQNEASWVEYTFNGVQRNSTSDDGSGNPPIEDDTPKPEVGELLVTNITDREVALAWGVGKNADSYRLERSNSNAGPWQVMTLGKEITLVDQSVMPATTYFYRLVYTGKDGQASVSDTVEATTLVSQTAPVITPISSSPTSVTFNWTEAKGSESYEVQTSSVALPAGGGSAGRLAQAAGAAPEWQTIATVEARSINSYQVSNLAPGTTMLYRVVPTGGQASNAVALATKINAPALVLTQPDGPTAVTLTWDAVEGAKDYIVEEADNANFTDTVELAPNTNTSVSRTLSGTGSRYYRVTVRSVENITATSSTRAINADARATAVDATPASSTAITVTWKPAQNVKQYHLLADANPDANFFDLTPIYSGTATSFVHSNLPAAELMYYWVGVEDFSGTIYYSPIAEGYTKLAPVTLTAGSPTQTSLTLKYKGWKNGSYSELSRSEVNGPAGVLPARFTVRASEYVSSNLAINTEYKYSGKVTYNLNGLGKEPIEVSQPLATVTASTLTGATVITNLTSTDSKVTVAWKKIKGAQGYRIERALDESFEDFVVAGTAASDAGNFTDINLTSSTEYFYRVVTLFAGSSDETSPVRPAVTKPLTMTATAAAVDTASIDVTWSPAAADASYTVTRTGPDNVPVEIYSGKNRSIRDSNLTSATPFSYKIEAEDAFGKTVVADATAVTKLAAPTATLVSVSEQIATLTWTTPNNATSYSVYRSTSPNMNSARTVYTGSSTSFTDTGLSPESNYYYVVMASGVNMTASSPIVTVTTANAASTLTLTAPEPTKVEAAWTPVAGASSYTLIRSDKPSMADATTVYSGPNTSFTDTTVKPGLTYYYQVVLPNSGSKVASIDTPLAQLALTATLKNAATPSAAANYRFTWTSLEGAASYSVYKVNADNSRTSVCTTTGTSCTDDVPDAAKTTYVVAAVAENGDAKAESEAIVVEEGLRPTGNITGNLPAKLGSNVASGTVVWDSPTTRYSYKLERSTSADFSNAVTLYQGSGDRYVEESLIPASRYYYRVTSTYNGYSFQTNVKELVTGVPPTKLTLTGTGAARQLSWAEVAGATSYELTRKLANNSAEVIYSGTNASFTDVAQLSEGLNYTYSVKATTAVGASNESSVTYVARINATIPVVTATSTRSASIEWAPVANATSYRLEVFSNANLTTSVFNQQGNASFTSQKVTGLNAEQTYYIRVTVTGSNATNSPSELVSFTTEVDLLQAAAVNGGPTSNTVTWNAVAGASSYKVTRSLTPGGNASEVYRGPATSFTDTNLSTGVRYYYTVTALANNAALGDPSAEVTAFTLWDNTVAEVRAISSTTEASKVEVTLASEPAGAKKYIYQYRLAGSSDAWTTFTSVNRYEPSLVLTFGQLRGAALDFRVLAEDAEGNQKASASSLAWVPLQAPSLSAPVSLEKALRISIGYNSSSSYYDRYRVQVSSSSDFSNAREEIVTPAGSGVDGYGYTGVTPKEITSLEADTNYYVRVRAENSSNGAQSPWTQAAGVAYSALSAPEPQVTATTTTASITWTSVPNAVSYSVYNCVGTNCTAVAQNITGTSYTVTELQPGTAYRYFVRANGANGSADSSTRDYATVFAGPVITKVSNQTFSGATITWTPVGIAGDTTRYTVQYSSTSNFASPVTVASDLAQSTTSFALNTLPADSKVYVRVIAFRSLTGESGLSNVVEVATLPPTPANFTVAAADATSSTDASVNLSWTPVNTATKYRVYYSTAAAMTDAVSFDTTEASLTKAGFATDSLYYFKIVSVGIDGTESARSAANTSVTTSIPKPSLTVAPVANNERSASSVATVYPRYVYRIYYTSTPDYTAAVAPVHTKARTTVGNVDTLETWSNTYASLTPGVQYYATLVAVGTRTTVASEPVVFTLPRTSTTTVLSFEDGESGVTYSPGSNFTRGVAAGTGVDGRTSWAVSCTSTCTRSSNITYIADGVTPFTFSWYKTSATTAGSTSTITVRLDGSQVFTSNATGSSNSSGRVPTAVVPSAGTHTITLTLNAPNALSHNVALDNITGVKYMD